MRKRGLIVAGAGAIMFGVSMLVAASIVESDVVGPMGIDEDSIFGDMFDNISAEIAILPGGTERASYEVESDGVLVMWAVQIEDYVPGDSLLVTLSDRDGTPYGSSVLDAEMKIDAVESARSGTMYLDIENTGRDTVHVVTMFSEDPDGSALFTDPDSSFNRVIMPLAAYGITALVGLVVLIAGLVIFLIDLRRRRPMDRPGGQWSGDWSDGR